MSQTVTTGCISVECNRIGSDIDVNVEERNISVAVSAENKNGISVDFENRNKDISVDTVFPQLGYVETLNVNKEVKVTFGIVCSVISGFAVLYASDGALITIDNNYLIVKDEGQVLST